MLYCKSGRGADRDPVGYASIVVVKEAFRRPSVSGLTMASFTAGRGS
ncbi:MAG: hypothetical protein QW756_06060 [Nitrososphaerota archaeon]